MKIRNVIILVVVLIFSIHFLYGQEDISKQVQVVKAYKPKVERVNKISELPEITDTTVTEISFDYDLLPKRAKTEFELAPVPAASMVGEPLTQLYPNYVKVGMGSKFSPVVEFHIGTKRSEDRMLGAYFKHNSSDGNVLLPQGNETFAGYSDNQIKLFGKRFFNNSVLEGDLGLKNNTRYFYGYDVSADTALNKSDIKQNYLRLNADIGFNSTYTDSAHLNYDFNFTYDHVDDKFDTNEDIVGINVDLDKFIDNNIVALSTGFDYLMYESPLDTGTNTLFHFKPTIAKFDDNWKLKGGINFVADAVNENTKLRLYPVAEMEYDIVNQYIIPYGGIDGNIDFNSYYRSTLENPFIIPGLRVENTNNKMIFYAGIKGNLTSSTYYNTGVKYNFFDNMPFFYNDMEGTNDAGNQFGVLYDNGECMNIYGELAFDFSESLNLKATGNYYQYALYNEPHPWHKPLYDLSLSAKYDIRNKIIFDAEAYLYGNRWAKNGLDGEEIEMGEFTDLNFKMEYRYTKVLSAYLQFKNLLADNYSIWHQYPVYGLQIYLGITYAF
ncbi:MAG: hypothetical protein R6U04_05405 [Bacteroidales bacterium]